jgi:hypothetical protein
MSAPSQIRNQTKLDNVDETIEMLLKAAHDQKIKFHYEFCGFFEVPASAQDFFKGREIFF